MRDLIAIAGKQFAGKDLIADLFIVELEEFRKVPIAKAIKTEFAELYRMTVQDIDADKAKYRSGLIALGQRRREKDPDYWIKRVLQHPGKKIISDMRMHREYDFFKQEGAFCIRVEATRDTRLERGTLVKEEDPTECELDAITEWDAVIENNGSIEDLKKVVHQVVVQLSG